MIRVVKGNLLRLSMPLQLRSVVDGEATVTDFVPTGPVYVLVSDGAPRHRYAAVMDGNKAVIEDNGTLDLGAYNIEVYCQDEAGHNYRHKIRNAFQVVDTACEACLEPGVEFDVETHTLDGAVFASYGITEETDPTVPDWVKCITEADIARWNAGGGGGYSVAFDDGNVIFSGAIQPTYNNGNIIF